MSMKTRETEKMEKAIEVLTQMMAEEVSMIREYLPGEHRDKLDTKALIRYSMDKLIDAQRVSEHMNQPTLVYAMLWQFGYHNRMAMDLGCLSDDDCDTAGLITLIRRFMMDVHQISNLGQDWEDEFGD